MEFDQILHTRFKWELLHIDFWKWSIELWALIITIISFSLNILRTNWWNYTKFYLIIETDWIYIGIAMFQFLKIYNMVMSLGCCQNVVSAQYLVNELIEFDQILHMHWP